MFSLFKKLAYNHRWIKRLAVNHLPDIDLIYLKKSKMTLAFSAKDLTGPSFHLSFGKEEGFQNYEEADKDFVVNYLIKHPGQFVDIGANIGLFSFYILQKLPTQKIIAFEPEPQAFKCLEVSKTQNNFNSFSPLNFAIGENKEELNFYLDANNFGGHHLHRINDAQKSIKVSVSPLREFLDDQKISVIKIDVEGAELNVLKGVKDVINKHKPLVVVECLNEDLGKKGAIYKFLSEFENMQGLCLELNQYVSLEEISAFALKQFEKGHSHDNYFLRFN